MYAVILVLAFSAVVLAAPLPGGTYRMPSQAYPARAQRMQAVQQAYVPRPYPTYPQRRIANVQGTEYTPSVQTVSWIPQGNGALFGRPYSYNGQLFATINSEVSSGTNTVGGEGNLVHTGGNAINSVGQNNALNTGTNTLTLSVNGEPTHSVSTGPISIGVDLAGGGGGGGGGSNTINTGSNSVEGNANTVVSGGNTVTSVHSGNMAHTGNNALNLNINRETYEAGKKVVNALGGEEFINSAGRAIGGFLGKLGVSVSPNEGGGGGGNGDNTISTGGNTISGNANTVLSGGNTINSHQSNNEAITGHNTLNVDLTGEPSASHNIMATHTPGSNTIETGTNTVEGTGNVVHSGENTINSSQSGHTVETGNNEVNLGGVVKWVKSKFGWQLVMV